MDNNNFLDKNLALEAVRVTEAAALSSSLLMGRGDEKGADQNAVNAMRYYLNNLSIDGTVVIGEGERDKAPMLYIGEKVGSGGPKIDIALDPLEGTSITAKGGENALSVLAMAENNGFLHSPDVYMEKIAVGKKFENINLSFDMKAEQIIKELSDYSNIKTENLVVCILDRPRHNDLIKSVRNTGARIKLISDGDVSAVIATTIEDSGVDLYIGSGGAPEGVLAAAALSCLECQMQTRLVFQDKNQKSKAIELGIKDLSKKYNIEDMVKADVIFCATGITDGDLVKGIKDLGNSFQSETFVLHKSSKINKIIKNQLNK